MSVGLPRRSLLAAALSLPAIAARAQTPPRPAPAPAPAAAHPLLMPNKATLYQRIITHPGATLSPRPDGQAAQPIAGFEVFYVYARQNDFVQVGRAADGRTDGWVPAAKTIEWKHTLVGAFTNPAHRLPVLFLDTADAERALLNDPHPADTARQMLADAQAGRPGHVIATEPASFANIDERFYLLPILSSTPVAMDFGPDRRLLEVLSVREPPPPAPTPEFKAAVVFLVDTTLSMQPWIDGTRKVVRSIVDKIRASPVGGKFRFGLVAYRDSLEDTPALEYFARLYAKPDFSQPADAVLPAIQKVQEATASSTGYDEDPIGGLKYTLDSIDWDSISPGHRHVILITDAAARTGDHPHSVTRMGITEVKQLANQRGVTLWAIHLQTPAGERANDWPLADKQYSELTAAGAAGSLYFRVPVQGGAGHYATQADFDNQADQIAKALIQATARTAGMPPPDLGPAHGPPLAQLQRQMPIIEEAMRLAYLGHVQQATAPEAVRSFTTDRDLADPSIASLGVRVLLTKNQLSDLANTLKQVLHAGRAGSLEPQNFFAQLQQTVASGFRDPQQIPHATQVGGLLGEFLDDLPYRSHLLELTAQEWEGMTAIQRDSIMNGIDERLSLYAAYDARPDLWYDLGHSHNPNEAVYPVPIEALP
jgi:hypothetical protein